jgi:hypothetical protein
MVLKKGQKDTNYSSFSGTIIFQVTEKYFENFTWKENKKDDYDAS